MVELLIGQSAHNAWCREHEPWGREQRAGSVEQRASAKRMAVGAESSNKQKSEYSCETQRLGR